MVTRLTGRNMRGDGHVHQWREDLAARRAVSVLGKLVFLVLLMEVLHSTMAISSAGLLGLTALLTAVAAALLRRCLPTWAVFFLTPLVAAAGIFGTLAALS